MKNALKQFLKRALRKREREYLRELIEKCQDWIRLDNSGQKFGIQYGPLHPHLVPLPKDGYEAVFLPSGTITTRTMRENIHYHHRSIPIVQVFNDFRPPLGM